MKERSYPSFTTVFQNCIDRKCTTEQLQDFIDRSRQNNLDNPEVLRQIDELEIKHLISK